MAALGKIKLDGFTMLGAYPEGTQWDSATGGEDVGRYQEIWNVPRLELDPVLGKDEMRLVGLWRDVDVSGYARSDSSVAPSSLPS